MFVAGFLVYINCAAEDYRRMHDLADKTSVRLVCPRHRVDVVRKVLTKGGRSIEINPKPLSQCCDWRVFEKRQIPSQPNKTTNLTHVYLLTTLIFTHIGLFERI